VEREKEDDMPTQLETWLAQVLEAPLEPDLPICDPHHHFWHARPGHDPYLLADLQRDAGSGHRIVQTVFVECHSEYRQDGPVALQPVGETVFVEAIANRSVTEPTAAAAGIVSHADFRLGNEVGELPIILNHIGRPLGIGPYAGKHDEVFPVWQEAISAVAACPNVVVKVGGLGNPISGFDWHQREIPPTSAELAETVAPYYLYCIEQFGANRCMFESNFPVDKASYSYQVVWNMFKRISQDFSQAERAALFHDTAARVYRLPAAPTA
jgi:predicted TIM-barrel fold metal-dependent hydrolase